MKHTVTEHKLPSGAKGLLVDVPGTDVIDIQIHFNSGFQFAGGKPYELPHVLEHLMSCGTTSHPKPNEFKTEIQKNGAFRNAYTSADMNAYVVEFASFETDRMLGMLDEYLTEPIFPVESLATEISNVGEELNETSQNYSNLTAINLYAAAYPGRGERLEPRLARLNEITIEDVRSHYQSTHTAGNMRFYVAGNLSSNGDKILDRLTEINAKLPAGERLEPDTSPGILIPDPIVEVNNSQSIYYRVNIFAGELSPAERRAMVILRSLLFAGYRSRIYGEARRLGLAYHVSGVGNSSKGSSVFGVAGFVTPGNANKLFNLISSEIVRAQSELASKAELDDIKQLIIGSTLRSHQTVSDMLSWYISPYDEEELVINYDQYLEELRAVTPAQVKQVAAKFGASRLHATSYVGDLTTERARELTDIFSPIWQ